MKIKFKIYCLLLVMLLVLICPAHALSDDINDLIDNQYHQYDFSSLDSIMDKYSNDSFTDVVKSILDGSFNKDDTFWSNLINIILPSLKNGIGNLPLILALMLVYGLLRNCLNDSNRFVSHINAAANALVSIMLIYSFIVIYKQAVQAYGSLNEILDAIIPILTIALISSGASGTAEVINPDGAMLSQLVGNILNHIVFPLIIFIAIFLVLNFVLIKDKYAKIISTIKNTVTWLVGTVFTIFAAIISIKGLVASSYDGISLRTFRYAVSNSIPLVGSLVGDGVNMALACCSIVKSAIGVAALILIILTMASPIMTLITYMISLKLLAAFATPLENNDATNLISSMADLVKILISALVGMIIVLLIIIGFTVTAANVI